MAALQGAFPGAAPQAQRLRVGGGLLGGSPAPIAPPRSPRVLLGHRQKHRMEEEEDASCPPSKRRVMVTDLEDWSLCLAQPMGSSEVAPQDPSGTLEIPCEEMEQATGEQPCEAARRKFQEIEDRITEDDDDDDRDTALAEGSISNLPTLILSETLKTGLKRDYEGALTKKIIESMSRPSMELVLWKPLPDFLTEKPKPVPPKSYKTVAERCCAKPAAPHAAFHPPPEELTELQPAGMPSDLYGVVGPPAGADEEMEL